MLRGWKASSIRAAGLCYLHFRDADFRDIWKSRLHRNSDPIHWKNAQILQKLSPEEQQQPHTEQEERVQEERREQEEQREREEQRGQEEQREQEEPREQEVQREQRPEEELQFEDIIVIVKSEDVLEIELPNVTSQETKGDPMKDTEVSDISLLMNEHKYSIPYDKRQFPRATSSPSKELSLNLEEVDTNKSHLNCEINVNNNNVNTTDDNINSNRTVKRRTDPQKEDSRCSVDCNLYTRSLKNRILSLEIKLNKVRRLIKNERNKIVRLRKQLNKQTVIRTIDDIVAHTDIPPAAKTLIKLQLHKNKSPYTDAEKDLAKQMYVSSPTHYSQMRSAGVRLPSGSAVRSWVAEQHCTEK